MPQAAMDAAERWSARSVCFVATGIAVGVIVSFAGNTLAHGFSLRFATVMSGELAVLGSVLLLNRRGLPLAAARLLAVSLPVLASALMVVSGSGLRDVAVLMLPGSLILSGLLLDRATVGAVTALTIACTASVILAEASGRLGTGRPRSALTDIPDAAIILGCTGLGVALVAGRLRQSHARLRRQEAELKASEALYRGLVDLAADAIVVSGPDAGIVEANRQASELTGRSREELLRTPLHALFDPAELEQRPFRYDLADLGRVVYAARTLTRRDGSQVPVEMSSRRMPDGQYQTILRDVSERQRAEAERTALEARLTQSQKLEAVGRLAGGVAHDFNNLLTAITGSLTLALRDVHPERAAHRWLLEIDKAAWRAASLTQQLLAFSRRQVIAPRVLDLRTLVAGSGSLLARMIGEDVALETRLDPEPCLVEVDQGQLEQVLLNLAANARDAMPDGGTLTISVSRADDAGGARPPRGPVVVLTVTDTGHGMTEEVRARIFEPFFTTKGAGGGTGLGLAMAYGAVEQNGGTIDVVSSEGRGASFRVVLPAARGRGTPVQQPRVEVPRGTESVLLVEDEAAVREVTQAQLESLGYSVTACASANEALTLAAGHDRPLHLLLTDVVMPGMNGRELAARLAATRPGLRVLFASGYGEDVIARHGVVEPGVLLLKKPFSVACLARLVREALDC
jgi:PAS domain S-box-containing protein